VADDTLYLKADEGTVREFEVRGLPPFQYNKGSRIVKLSYYLAPEEVLEDPDDALTWGRRALEAALRARTPG
jgi:DNA transformation protein